jgi:hypothetical protein
MCPVALKLRLFKVGHARRHPIGENWPGADGKDAKGCERSDNRCDTAKCGCTVR